MPVGVLVAGGGGLPEDNTPKTPELKLQPQSPSATAAHSLVPWAAGNLLTCPPSFLPSQVGTESCQAQARFSFLSSPVLPLPESGVTIPTLSSCLPASGPVPSLVTVCFFVVTKN